MALAALVLAACALFVQPNTAQSASRMALTAALAERGTTELTGYEDTLGADYAVKDGVVYSDKAPGQPLSMVPAWWAYRLVGGEPGTVIRVDDHLGLWWLVLWSSAVPAALLAVVIHRVAASRLDPTPAVIVTLGLSLGTLLLPFGTLLFGHTLAALLAYGSWVASRPVLTGTSDRPARAAALAGVLAAGAVAVEYTVAIVAAVIGVAYLVRARRQVWAFALGAVPIGLLVAGYHAVTFGGPLEHAYRYSVFDLHHSTLAGVGAPDLGTLVAVLVGDRGLLLLTPMIGVAAAGFLGARRDVDVVEVAVPLAIAALYLVFAAGWIDPTGGYSPGPRHLVPAIPFLTLGAIRALQRWPRAFVAASVFGAATMALATIGDPQLPTNLRPALRLWIERLADGRGAHTLLSPLIGGWGLLVVGALVAVAAGHLRRTLRASAPEATPEESSLTPSAG